MFEAPYISLDDLNILFQALSFDGETCCRTLGNFYVIFLTFFWHPKIHVLLAGADGRTVANHIRLTRRVFQGVIATPAPTSTCSFNSFGGIPAEWITNMMLWRKYFPGFKYGYLGMIEIFWEYFWGETLHGNHSHRISVWKFCPIHLLKKIMPFI